MNGKWKSFKKGLKWVAVGIVVSVLVMTAVFLFWRHREQTRLQTGSQLIATTAGPIEYSSFGDGPVVLVLHGTIGGYDQGQALAEMLDTDAYQFISVSRPGYLRTPLTTGMTFEEQADAYVALLDALEIEQVAVMAISGGGPPALQLALNHPDRVWGLVMISTNSDVNAGREEVELHHENESAPPPMWLVNLIFSDFTSWLATIVATWQPRWVLPGLVGEAYVDVVLDDPENYEIYTALVDSFALTSQRREGSFHEGQIFLRHTGYPFAEIETPMLILHGTEDSLGIARQQHYLAETVSNSEFVAIEGGTHFMAASHNDEIVPFILDFLEENAP